MNGKHEGFYCAAIVLAIVALLVGSAGGLLAYGLARMRQPLDTHWNRELSVPRWTEGHPMPEDEQTND